MSQAMKIEDLKPECVLYNIRSSFHVLGTVVSIFNAKLI